MNEIICLRKISGIKVRMKKKTQRIRHTLNHVYSEPRANSKVTKELTSSSDLLLKFYPNKRKKGMSHFFIHPFIQKDDKLFRIGVHGEFSLK